MHPLPDDLGTLTPEQLLDAYAEACARAAELPGPRHANAVILRVAPLREELLRRLRLAAADAEVRRLRKICADALPFAETALRAGLDFGPEVQDELVNSHAMIVALRSAGH